MSEQVRVAMIRAAVGGLLTGLLVLLTTLQTTAADDPTRLEKALIAGGVALLTYVITRGGFEGAMDQGRAERAEIQPSDVGWNLVAEKDAA